MYGLDREPSRQFNRKKSWWGEMSSDNHDIHHIQQITEAEVAGYCEPDQVEQYENYDLESIVTPINVKEPSRLLHMTNYDEQKSQFLIEGFTNGFDIGYEGPIERQSQLSNIPFTVGNRDVMWEKIMKEVKAKRFAGPYETIPYTNYIQSPIGLVPKSGGRTRLIFHLSYNFSEDLEKDGSVNHFMPEGKCKVKYKDIDHAVQLCLRLKRSNNHEPLFAAKSDLQNAFRMAPLSKKSYQWLILKATNPLTNKEVYFVEKALSFGESVSCSHFQGISDGLHHILETITQRKYHVTNYLDEFLFMERTEQGCNDLVRQFIRICKNIGVPVAMDKTEWGTNSLTFLGILLNMERFVLAVPEYKNSPVTG